MAQDGEKVAEDYKTLWGARILWPADIPDNMCEDAVKSAHAASGPQSEPRIATMVGLSLAVADIGQTRGFKVYCSRATYSRDATHLTHTSFVDAMHLCIGVRDGAAREPLRRSV